MPKNTKLMEWNANSRAINRVFRAYYQLAYFSRNLNARMNRDLSEGLNPDERLLMLDAWKMKLKHLREMEKHIDIKIPKKNFKDAENCIKQWSVKLCLLKKPCSQKQELSAFTTSIRRISQNTE